MNWLSIQTVAQISVERILNALPEGFLIAFFAWLLLRVLRRQNSGTRFAVWFLALLAVAALPVLGVFGAGHTRLAAGMSSGTWGSMRPAINIPARWALFVFLSWALGAGVALVRLTMGLRHLRRLRRSCAAIVAADLDAEVRKTVEAIGMSGSVTVTTSEYVRVPAAIGFWKRTIVLPTWALRELPAGDLNVILLHEFAHLRRWDDWSNLVQKIVRSLFFFHPAVWWIENRLSVEREMACDDAVLAQTANPHGYATCLISLLEKSLAHRLSSRPLDKRWSLAQAAVHRAREASLRLAQILDTNRPVATRIWKPALGIVGAFSMVCLVALPHAPRFVACDRGLLNSDHAYSTNVSQPSLQSSLQPAAVIPASWRTGESSSVERATKVTSTKAVHARISSRNVIDRFALTRSAAARVNAAPSGDQFVESGSASQEIVPVFQTVVFVEATQYGVAHSSVWQVYVWRVTLVSAVQERAVRVPAVNSI